MTITEQEALAVTQAYAGMTDPAQQQRAAQFISQYKTQQQGAGASFFPTLESQRNQQRQAEFQKLRGYYTRDDYGLTPEGRKQYDDLSQRTIDPEATRLGVFNDEYLAWRTGQPINSLTGRREVMMEELARHEWGHEGPIDDKGFYAGMKSVYQLDDDLGKAAEKAALSGSLTAAQPWGQVKMERAGKPGWNAAKERDYAKDFTRKFYRTREIVGDYLPLVQDVYNSAQKSVGVGESAEAKGLSDVAELLAAVPKEDQKRVWYGLHKLAEADGVEPKDVFGKIATTFERRVAALATDLPTAAAQSSLYEFLDQLQKGEEIMVPKTLFKNKRVQGPVAIWNALKSLDESGGAMVAGLFGTLTPMTNEQRAGLLDAIPKALDEIAMADDIRQFAQGTLDPIKPEGVVEMVGVGLADTLPFIAASYIPGGLALNLGSYTMDNQRQLLAKNPGMDRETAFKIAAVTAPIQAAGDMIEGSLLVGKLPGFSNALKQITGNAVGRWAQRFGASVAVEMGVENAQDIAPFAAQAVASALSQDVPEVPWSDVIGEMKGNQGQILAVVIPLALMGASVGSYTDFKNGRAMLQDVQSLEAGGIEYDRAQEIARMAQDGDMKGAEAMLRKEFVKTDFASPEVQQRREAAATRLKREASTQQKAESEAEAIGIIPRIGKTASGYSLRFEDDTTTDFPTFDEARTARAEFLEQKGASEEYVYGALASQILHFERTQAGGGEVTFDQRQEAFSAEDFAELNPEQAAAIFKRVEIENALTGADAQASEQYILGSSDTQKVDNVYRTTASLFKGATAQTVIEEKVEGDAKRMIDGGMGDKLRGWIRALESDGNKLLADNSDEALVEGYSRVTTAYSLMNRKELTKLGLDPTGLRKVGGGLRGILNNYRAFFGEVFKRALALRKSMKKGEFSPELEAQLRKSLGISEQTAYEADVVQEAMELSRPSFSLSPANTIEPVLSAARNAKRGERPVSVEVGRLSSEVSSKLPEGFERLQNWSIRIDEDLIRKNDELSRNKRASAQLGIEPVIDEDYQKLSDIINRADEVSLGEKRKDGTETIIFKKQDGPTYLTTTAIRNKKGYLAVVRFVREPLAALPLAESTSGRLELTSDTESDQRETPAGAIEENNDTDPEKRQSYSMVSKAQFEALEKAFERMDRDPEARQRRLLNTNRDFTDILRSWENEVFNPTSLEAKHQLELDELRAERDLEVGGARADGATQVEVTRIQKAFAVKMAELQAKQAAESQAETTRSNDAALLAALRAQDALMLSLPAEIRARLGGAAKIATLKTDEARLKLLLHRAERGRVELEKLLRKEFRGEISKIFDRARQRGGAGEKAEGKIGAESHVWFTEAERAASLDPAKVDGELDSIEKALEGDISQEKIDELAAWLGRPVASAEEARDWLRERQTILEVFGSIMWGTTTTGVRSAEEMASAYQTAKTRYTDARMGWLQKITERREHREAERNEHIQSIGGPATDDDRRSQQKNKSFKRKAANYLDQGFGFSDFMRDLLGERATAAIESARRATITEKDNLITRQNEFREMMRTVFAGGMRQRQRRLRELQVIQKGTPLGTISELQALQYSMWWRDPDSREWLSGNGYGPEWQQKAEEWLSPESKAIRTWLLRGYDQQYNRINTVFRAIRGVNLPRVSNYGGMRLVENQGSDAGLDLTPEQMAGSMATGFLKKRMSRPTGPPRPIDALTNYWNNAFAVEHYIAWGETSSEFRAVLGHRDVKLAVEANRGQAKRKQLARWLDDLEQGGLRNAIAGTLAGEFMNRQGRAAASIALLYKIAVLMKQFPAMLGSAFKLGLKDYTTGLARVTAGKGAISPAEMFRSPTIQRRIASYDVEMRQSMEGFDSQVSDVNNFMDLGWDAIGRTDAIFTTVSASVAYDVAYRQAQKIGMNDAAAHEAAREQTDLIVGETAQPDSVMDRSQYELSVGAPWLRVVFAFQSANRQAAALMYAAMKNQSKSSAANAFVLSHFLIPTIIQTIGNLLRWGMSDDDWDETWDIEDYVNAWLTGSLSGALQLGFAVEAIQAFTGVESRTAFSPASTLAKELKNIDFEDLSAKDIGNILTAAGTLLGGRAAALGVTWNAVKQALGISERVSEEN